MKTYTIPAGTMIERWNQDTSQWSSLYTTKEVTYTDADVIQSGTFAYVFRLPKHSGVSPYTRISVNVHDVEERPAEKPSLGVRRSWLHPYGFGACP